MAAACILDEPIDIEELKKFERLYLEQLNRGHVLPKTQFEYAFCLVKKLFQSSQDDQARRDYLYYLAIGNSRISEYDTAIRYTKAILQAEPSNVQVNALQKEIDNRMKKEGLIGAATVGGAALLGVAGVVALGFALFKGAKST